MEDYIIMVCQALLAAAMVPTLLRGPYPPQSTNVVTGTLLGVLAACMFSLGLLFSGIALVVSALIWYGIAIRALIEGRGK